MLQCQDTSEEAGDNALQRADQAGREQSQGGRGAARLLPLPAHHCRRGRTGSETNIIFHNTNLIIFHIFFQFPFYNLKDYDLFAISEYSYEEMKKPDAK